MPYTERWYQEKAIKSGLNSRNEIEVLPTGSGKSLVIASTVAKIDHDVLVLQPSLEILKSNYLKACEYGMRAEIFSASAGMRNFDRVTYATIGSIINELRYFRNVKTILIDECHLVNAKGGMYDTLIKELKPERLIGYTATPYRQHSTSMGTNMRILSRTKPKIFNNIGFYVNPAQLLADGHLKAPRVFTEDADTSMLRLNTTGAEFTEASKQAFASKNRMVERIARVAAECGGNHLLIFVESLKEAAATVDRLHDFGITATSINAKTPKGQRADNLRKFEEGGFRAMVNVGTLTTGYDFPALDRIIDGSTTMSAALHYQKMGRIYRPYDKDPAVYDLAGNMRRLGDPLKYTMAKNFSGKHEVYCEQGRVTGRIMAAEPECELKVPFGRFVGKMVKDLPEAYLHFMVEKSKTEWRHIMFGELVRRRIVAGTI